MVHGPRDAEGVADTTADRRPQRVVGEKYGLMLLRAVPCFPAVIRYNQLMSVKLHFKSYGKGQPILILHGLFGSGRNWTAFARKLAGHYRVITIDVRNHGDSGHADSMTYPEMALDVRNVLDECELERASVIGHSMGGKVAMAFALCYGARVDRLTVLDIAPVSYKNSFRTIIESLQGLPLPCLNDRKHADELLAERINDTSLRLFLLQNLVKVDGDYRWRVNLAALKSNLDDIGGFPGFEAVRPHAGPTLFLGGKNSTHLHTQHIPVIKQYFTNALVDYIENAGHWLHVDQPGIVLDRIIRFLRTS